MHGLIVVDKGEDLTSARAIDPIKRALRMRRRVGHAGTLDPFATGVLIVLCGDVTRLAESVLTLPKTYRATVLFGTETETLDIDGEVIARADPGTAPPSELESVLSGFVGEIEQVPPAHSALRVGGTRAYRLARKGCAPELAPRPVTIHSLRITNERWPRLDLEVSCGSGTYVRSLARDLGAAFGLPAHLEALRRTAIGPFTAEDGVRIGFGQEPSRTTILRALRPPLVIPRAVGYPETSLTLPQARVFIRGNTVPMPRGPEVTPESDRLHAFLDDTGEFLLGLGVFQADGSVRPKKVLPHAVEEIERRVDDR